uniref:CKLF like MARVEL transmembrane domain containing 7 n=1 Tax=Equus asinus TaxID=9793 RepID=A0A9L0IAI9_EQUAS
TPGRRAQECGPVQCPEHRRPSGSRYKIAFIHLFNKHLWRTHIPFRVPDTEETTKNKQVTLLIAFICVRSSPWTSYSAYSYFEVVTICNLIMILAFYLVHLFRLYRVLTCISWPLSELLHYLIGTLLLLIASIVAASKSYNQSGLVAGAIFGFIASFLCLASIWLSYKISCVTQSTDVTA